MLGQAIFIPQPDCGIRLKKIPYQLQHFWQRLIQIATGSKRTGQPVQSGGAFFTAALSLLAFVQLRGQMSNDNRDDEIRAEHHEVLELADVKRVARRNEQKVPQE